MSRYPLLAAAVGAMLVLAPSSARAGQSYDNCTGMITSLPATITTQGTWCLNENLVTSIAAGSAITIGANNITIDCNDFKIGGLQGGLDTIAIGIISPNNLNTTIRNCGVRGFYTGIRISGASSFGALIEDNRVDNNTLVGIDVAGSGHIVRRNRVVDSGGRPASGQAYGIMLSADQSTLTDNLISGVAPTAIGGDAVGISSSGDANEIGGNYITGLTPPDVTGDAFGISAGASTGSAFHDNRILNPVDVDGAGILSLSSNFCSGNTITGFAVRLNGCDDAGGNIGD